MKIISKCSKLKKELTRIENLGFVPTMGSLHKGHEYLIKRSKKKCKKTIVSIFINPTQFNNPSDFRSYPKNINQDLKILKKMKVDFVFIPKTKDIYTFKRKKKIKINKNDLILCAKKRKGHFEGVIDIMDRLTNLINPKIIFMGEKDFQQYFLVKKFIESKYSSKIAKCKTIRDNKYIALSSRNLLLGKKSLNTVASIIKELKNFKKKIKKQNVSKSFLQIKKKYLIKKYNIKIDYLELRNENNLKISRVVNKSRLFFAFFINKIRLIDNL